MPHPFSKALHPPALAITLALLLSGCGSGGNNPNPPPTAPAVTSFAGSPFNGSAHSGSQPLSGATIQLYAAGTSGNGSSATALLSSALATDSTGSFTVPAGYPCPTSTSQIYVIARGGHIGSSSNNSAIALISALGPCNLITSSSHFVLNEATTAATTWALAQFLSAGGNIGASATNITGLSNAVNTAASLVNPATGTAPGAAFPANGSAPIAKINTLANLLNTCGTSASACPTVLGSAQNTLDAALNIVRNPAANVATLYAQSTASAAFSPALTQAPSDWTLFINFTGGGMDSPSGLGIDATGNVWVGSYFSATNPDPTIGSATEFSPLGKALYPNGITGSGLENVYGLAIDSSNNVWIPNEASPGSINSGLGSVTVLNSSGQPVSGKTGFTAGGIDYPISIAIDSDASAWILDFGNSHLTHLSSTGSALSGSAGYTSNFFVFPVAIALDAGHNIWVANQSDVTVTKVSSDAKTITNVANCCQGPSGLAIDQSGNVWVANYFGDSISQVTSSGIVNPSGPFTGNGSIYHPQGVAIDGSGSVWVANFRAPYLTQLAGAATGHPGQLLSPNPGWAPDSRLFGAFSIAIDASGNIWVTNFNSNTLTQFVGLASPVKTPLIGLPQVP
jgi:streptogramin lyase